MGPYCQVCDRRCMLLRDHMWSPTCDGSRPEALRARHIGGVINGARREGRYPNSAEHKLNV